MIKKIIIFFLSIITFLSQIVYPEETTICYDPHETNPLSDGMSDEWSCSTNGVGTVTKLKVEINTLSSRFRPCDYELVFCDNYNSCYTAVEAEDGQFPCDPPNPLQYELNYTVDDYYDGVSATNTWYLWITDDIENDIYTTISGVIFIVYYESTPTTSSSSTSSISTSTSSTSSVTTSTTTSIETTTTTSIKPSTTTTSKETSTTSSIGQTTTTTITIPDEDETINDITSLDSTLWENIANLVEHRGFFDGAMFHQYSDGDWSGAIPIIDKEAGFIYTFFLLAPLGIAQYENGTFSCNDENCIMDIRGFVMFFYIPLPIREKYICIDDRWAPAQIDTQSENDVLIEYVIRKAMDE